MRTIHKYHLPVEDLPVIKMPMGAEILCAKSQRGQDITLWAIVETYADEERRKFCVVGTGHPIPHLEGAALKFIDTAILSGGDLVFHVFEVVQQ